ncbi:MAG: alpha/beta hydrolase, partial [Rhodobacteraceae bacterium]|nr:alpha/beta hydrolase [Paracoccaceae bacterium]
MAEAAFPPQGQFLLVEGHRVHAVVAGTGPDLVLIHGASGTTRDFSFDLIPALAQRYRVIAFDRPGLGYSDDLGEAGLDPREQARVLALAADQLGVTSPVVLGQSYGGIVALAWAELRPRQVAALVLVSGVALPWPGDIDPLYRLIDGP